MDDGVLRGKFLGALVGTAVGDAVGSGFEWQRAADVQAIEWAADRRELLTYTDDTHMMIGMAESLVQKEGFDGGHMAHVFVRNYEMEPWRGYGPGPPNVFRMIRAGEDWDKAAEELYHGGSYGNGSAMRIAPLAVFYHKDLTMLREVAYRSSQITHSHVLGKEGAALQAYAVALAVGLEPDKAFEPRGFLSRLNELVHHEAYQEKLESLGMLLGDADEAKVVTELGNGVEAFNSVPTAIYSFVSHPDSFREAILFAVSLGGDTDTIAAMTGAISGAYLGVEAVPEKWRLKLENRLYIEELAAVLYDIWIRGRKVPD
ncbi:MAG: ADP-ribosylglycohydrolase family protein [Dehalococcoidia bacterium]|nr:ADP-ribosylglycohydrolase family protein [Dehalococcoidia bacterium]